MALATWSAEDLDWLRRELEAIAHQHRRRLPPAEVKRLAEHLRRSNGAVVEKVAKLRRNGLLPDVEHGPAQPVRLRRHAASR